MNINIPQNITIKNKILMIEGIISAVDIHRQAIKYVSVIFIHRAIHLLILTHIFLFKNDDPFHDYIRNIDILFYGMCNNLF